MEGVGAQANSVTQQIAKVVGIAQVIPKPTGGHCGGIGVVAQLGVLQWEVMELQQSQHRIGCGGKGQKSHSPILTKLSCAGWLHHGQIWDEDVPK